MRRRTRPTAGCALAAPGFSFWRELPPEVAARRCRGTAAGGGRRAAAVPASRTGGALAPAPAPAPRWGPAAAPRPRAGRRPNARAWRTGSRRTRGTSCWTPRAWRRRRTTACAARSATSTGRSSTRCSVRRGRARGRARGAERGCRRGAGAGGVQAGRGVQAGGCSPRDPAPLGRTTLRGGCPGGKHRGGRARRPGGGGGGTWGAQPGRTSPARDSPGSRSAGSAGLRAPRCARVWGRLPRSQPPGTAVSRAPFWFKS